MIRLLAKIFSAALALLVALPVAPASADPPSAAATASFWYAGTRLAFDRPAARNGALAIAVDDAGLGRFLLKLGATLSYQPGQNAIVVTSGDRRSISFAVGDPKFAVDSVPQSADFAPYLLGGTAYLPFLDLAKALAVVPVDDKSESTVLQPQIGVVEVRQDRSVTFVTVRGASPLRFKRLSDSSDEKLSLAFLGIGSDLDRERQVTSSALRALSITVGGTPRNPTTVLNFDATAGATHVLVPTDSANVVTIAFAPPGIALAGTQVPVAGDASTASVPLTIRDPHSTPAPPQGPFRGALATLPPLGTAPVAAAERPVPQVAVPPPLSGPVSAPDAPATPTPTAYTLGAATVTSLESLATDDGGLRVRLGISGPVTFEWHRLADFRWYVDLKPATLAIAAQDAPLSNAAVQSLRLKQFVGPSDRLPTVRLGLTLPSPRVVTLTPDASGLTVAVAASDDPFPTTASMGELLDGTIVGSIVPLPPPPPLPESTPPAAWKFGTPAVATNPRLIVIDPGHGGSDFGAVHNGMNEKDLTLDMSRRLRTALVNRGWEVKMTRDSDVDVFAPNDSAKEELQARVDVANHAGARFLVSVHVNAFTTADLNGTTTYYFRDDAYGLGQAVHARLTSALPTKDDGLRKENFYVIHHCDMPGILVETAFVSNPSDAALLRTEAFRQHVAEAIANGIGDYAAPGSALPAGN